MITTADFQLLTRIETKMLDKRQDTLTCHSSTGSVKHKAEVMGDGMGTLFCRVMVSVAHWKTGTSGCRHIYDAFTIANLTSS